MNYRLLVANALLLSALTGCVAVPDSEQQNQLVEAQSVGLTGESFTNNVQQPQWWQAFGDEQLNQLVSQALNDNPSLASAQARLQAAAAQVYAAGGQRLPTLSLDGDITRQRLSEHYIYPEPYAGSMQNFGQLQLALAWDLDFWGRQKTLLQQAGFQQQASALELASIQQNLAASVVDAYLNVYQANELMAIAERSEQQRQELLQLTQARVDAGLDTELELHNVASLLAVAKQSRLAAQARRDNAVHLLAALCGGGVERYAAIRPPQINIAAQLNLPGELPVNLLARRPDVLASRALVSAADSSRLAAKAAFYPDISLQAFAGFQAIGLDNLLQSSSQVYGVGPALHLPIFDGRRLKAGYVGATAALDQAMAGYNQTVLNAVREAADQLTLKQSLSAQHSYADDSLRAAEQAWKVAQARYKAGLTNQLVVLDAESRVLDARRNLLSSEVTLASARVGLMVAIGGSFDPQNFQVAQTNE